MKNILPRLDYLKQCFVYAENSPSGLKWQARPPSHFKTIRGHKTFIKRCSQRDCGYIINNGSKKYWVVKIDQVKYYCHRIVFYLVTGIDPGDQEVDHKDLNGLNNSVTNLRLASRRENSCNRGSNKNSTSPYKGVSFENRTQKWYAQISFRGKNFYLGRFETPELAKNAYDQKVNEIHGLFGRKK